MNPRRGRVVVVEAEAQKKVPQHQVLRAVVLHVALPHLIPRDAEVAVGESVVEGVDDLLIPLRHHHRILHEGAAEGKVGEGHVPAFYATTVDATGGSRNRAVRLSGSTRVVVVVEAGHVRQQRKSVVAVVAVARCDTAGATGFPARQERVVDAFKRQFEPHEAFRLGVVAVTGGQGSLDAGGGGGWVAAGEIKTKVGQPVKLVRVWIALDELCQTRHPRGADGQTLQQRLL